MQSQLAITVQDNPRRELLGPIKGTRTYLPDIVLPPWFAQLAGDQFGELINRGQTANQSVS